MVVIVSISSWLWMYVCFLVLVLENTHHPAWYKCYFFNMTVAVLTASDYFLFEKWFEHRCFFFSSLQKALVKNLIGEKKGFDDTGNST